MHCDGEVLDDTLWNTVESNAVAILPCPFTTSKFYIVTTCNYVILLVGQLETQTRLCQNNGLWSDVDNYGCPSQEIAKLWEDVS